MDLCRRRQICGRGSRVLACTVLGVVFVYLLVESTSSVEFYNDDSVVSGYGMPNAPVYRPLEARDKVTLALFTTIRDVEFRRRIHETTLYNWRHLSEHVVPILFVHNVSAERQDPQSWASRALAQGWHVLNYGRTGDGVPVLKDMYQIITREYSHAKFIGYANADILFDYNLLWTLDSIASQYRDLDDQHLLVTGRRCNVPSDHFHRVTGAHPGDPTTVTQISQDHGVTFHHDSADYFIFSRAGFYWDKMPDFIVGRIGFDSWFLGKVVQWKIPSIDATGTVNAVHQTGPDGNYASQNMSRDLYYNHRMMPYFNYKPGSHNCAPLYTAHDLCTSNEHTCPRVHNRTYNSLPWTCVYWRHPSYYVTRIALLAIVLFSAACILWTFNRQCATIQWIVVAYNQV